MKLLLCLLVVLCFLLNSCSSSALMSDDALVATETSVVNGHSSVLFVIRTPEDGQWIFLTDEQASRELVIYALFQDLAAFDTTLNQVRDLPVGWKATRPAKGAPWVKEKFLANKQLIDEVSKRGRATSSREGSSRHRDSTALPRFYLTVFEEDEGSTSVRQIEFQAKSLVIWNVERGHERTLTLLWRDSLTAVARRAVDSLVQLCGPDTLKEFYIDPLNSPGKKFSFSIWDTRSERSTMSQLRNCWVPSLHELCTYINTLLPKRYAMELDLSKE